MKTDTLTTVLGILQAVAVSIVNFVVTAPETDGSRWTNPVFYVGLVIAALMAVKAYYTKGVEGPAPAKP